MLGQLITNNVNGRKTIFYAHKSTFRWLLATGCWPLASGRWLLVTAHLFLAVCLWLGQQQEASSPAIFSILNIEYRTRNFE
jgi:hypothetical protein